MAGKEKENKKTDVNDQEEEELEEMTDAQQSVVAQGRATKSELLGALMQIAGSMTKDQLAGYLKKVTTDGGKGGDYGDAIDGGLSSKNQASVSMKPSDASSSPGTSAMKEDVDELFSGQEDLSEEFRDKASTLFESAVISRVEIEKARLEEEYETRFDEKITESIDELKGQLDQYTDYVAKKWLEENEMQVENAFRSEIAENFLQGLKKLFEENHVEVPDEKVDVVEDLVNQNNELKESLEKIESRNMKLTKLIEEAQLEAAFDDVVEGLADTQANKLKGLAENIEYSSVDEYRRKLTTIREHHFGDGTEERDNSTGLIDEESTVGLNDVEEEDSSKTLDPTMKSIYESISRHASSNR